MVAKRTSSSTGMDSQTIFLSGFSQIEKQMLHFFIIKDLISLEGLEYIKYWYCTPWSVNVRNQNNHCTILCSTVVSRLLMLYSTYNQNRNTDGHAHHKFVRLRTTGASLFQNKPVISQKTKNKIIISWGHCLVYYFGCTRRYNKYDNDEQYIRRSVICCK